ncbi:MAG TPA: RNA polymerase sigma-70 factor [Bacteroidales bacterium]|nr:RNA polymerase sigma-70 factor [Bacteroidales bacterium]
MINNDIQVQQKIRGGDITEFRALFNRYYEQLCRYSFNIIKDMDAAEDIVQEFFYHFWKNRGTTEIKLSLNAYLYQAIRNNSLHYLQHLIVKQQYAEKAATVSEPETVPDEETLLEMEELNKAIASTLQKLPERCSRIFKMNRFEGRKYREIAEILSISVKTVEADMGKALQVFRASLKEFTNAQS